MPPRMPRPMGGCPWTSLEKYHAGTTAALERTSNAKFPVIAEAKNTPQGGKTDHVHRPGRDGGQKEDGFSRAELECMRHAVDIAV
jgi:hypothetical protein